MRVNYPRDETWEDVFDRTIELALDSYGRVIPEKKTLWEPIEFLQGATYPGDCAAAKEGATYKSLAYVAHRLGMDDDDRKVWYGIARRLCLSQAHIGCIIARINERDELFADLDRLVEQTT
jgi:hypothetical protein